NQSWRKLMRSVVNGFLPSLFLNATGTSIFAQDILLSDFEQSNYVWLPGGVWTASIGDRVGDRCAIPTLASSNTNWSSYSQSGESSSFVSRRSGGTESRIRTASLSHFAAVVWSSFSLQDARSKSPALSRRYASTSCSVG